MPLNRVQFDSNNNVNVVGGLTAPNLVARQGTTGPINFSSSSSVLGTGMDLITPTSVVGSGVTLSGGQVSFNAATIVSVNGCFSSLYDNYRIYLSGVCSDFSGLDSRLRLSGSDSAVNYGGQTLRASGATVSAASGATTAATIGAIHTTQSIVTIDLVGPSKTQQTVIYGVCGLGSAPRIDHCASFHNNATAYDGITFLPDVGTSGRTLTGTIRIYGMRNQ